MYGKQEKNIFLIGHKLFRGLFTYYGSFNHRFIYLYYTYRM